MTKLISFYLPQFHSIPENDLWWGRGFTEWTNVKKAQPLFKGHNQPRIPLNNNYYSLLESDTLRWQASLMNEYGVDGMCFYHYWFNGKQLLETPLKLLLENPDIHMPFCLSWANEPWTRAWDGGDREVLMPQEYGNEAEWDRHFDYLVNAFKDPRYIQHERKPMLLIYRAASIPNLEAMLTYFQKRAINAGFEGIYFVKMNTVFKDPYEANGFDASVDFEPMHTIGHHYHGIDRYKRSFQIRCRKLFNKIVNKNKKVEDRISYSGLWEKIVSRPLKADVYAGAFVDWDNTARKSERGLVLEGSSPKQFKHYFSIQYNKSKSANMPYMFINAWNEWAEGTYLEPDKTYGFQYLEAIKEIKGS